MEANKKYNNNIKIMIVTGKVLSPIGKANNNTVNKNPNPPEMDVKSY